MSDRLVNARSCWEPARIDRDARQYNERDLIAVESVGSMTDNDALSDYEEQCFTA